MNSLFLIIVIVCNVWGSNFETSEKEFALEYYTTNTYEGAVNFVRDPINNFNYYYDYYIFKINGKLEHVEGNPYLDGVDVYEK